MSQKNVNINWWGCLVWPTVAMVGLIFLSLKLINVGLPSEWSWWVVLLPWYGPPVFLFLLWAALKVISIVLYYLATVVGDHGRRKRKERERKNEM